jgi:hypothetical protein
MWLLDKLKDYKPVAFIRKALAEQDGTPSLSRVTAFFVTIATIAWVTYVVIHTGALPDLTSASLFIAGGHGGYAANKISEAIGAKNVSPSGNPDSDSIK